MGFWSLKTPELPRALSSTPFKKPADISLCFFFFWIVIVLLQCAFLELNYWQAILKWCHISCSSGWLYCGMSPWVYKNNYPLSTYNDTYNVNMKLWNRQSRQRLWFSQVLEVQIFRALLQGQVNKIFTECFNNIFATHKVSLNFIEDLR